jgi:hypothetical protein
LEQMLFRTDAAIVAAVVAGLMLLAWALGSRQGRKPAMDPHREAGSKIVDATIALLGLLLAFTFAMALDRHGQRRLMLVEQANGIGDFYTCATLLPGPERAELRSVIRTYAKHELDALRTYLDDAERRKVIQESFQLHGEMTEIVSRAIARGTPIAVSLTNTLNNVTSAHASRTAVYEERLPWPVQALLIVTACVAAYLLGRQQGPAARTCAAGTVSFILLVSMVIFVIKDLSQPRRGWIKANYASMVLLVESLKE